MNLPLGFEEYPSDSLASNTKFDGFDNKSKKLVLIAAPVDFDAQTLKGQKYVLDGVNTIDDHADSGQEKWEINASSAKSDEHLNILLSTSDGNVQVVPPIEDNVNIVRNIVIPHVKYPKVSKEITRLPKPDYLRPRWQPFGSGDPVIVPSKNKSIKTTYMEKIKKKKHQEVNVSPLKSKKDKKQESVLNDETPEKKKKKKKKKSKEIVENNNEQLQVDENVLDIKNEDIHSSKATPKKKKKKQTVDKEDNTNKVEHSKSKTKQITNLKQEIESDIDSDTEDKLFGLKDSKKQQTEKTETTAEVPMSSKKKKRKRKSAAPVETSVVSSEKKVKVENVEENETETKTKKKKKKKKRAGGD